MMMSKVRSGLLRAALMASCCMSGLLAQRVGIGTASPENRARLHVEDTERGIIIPRLTTAQRDAIPAADLTIGVIIYNKDCHRLEWWDGTRWVAVVTNATNSLPAPTALAATSITGNSFTANWTAVAGVSTYELAVSTTPSFTNLLPGYPKVITGVSSIVSGLSCGVYYYRVRAVGSSCDIPSDWSNTREVLVSPTLPACITPNSWVQLPDPPADIPLRNNHVAVTFGTKIYMGFGDVNRNCLNDWWEWDICTGTWTQKASPPAIVGALPFAFVIGDYIYVGGGRFWCGGPLSAVYRYDPANDTWTNVAPLPSPRHGAPGTSDGTYGYVLAGLGPGNTYTNTLYRYDPSTDTWTSLANYPQNIWIPALAYVDGYLYATQGYDGNNYVNNSYRYNIATDTWEPISNHPNEGYDGWGVNLNGRFLVVGNHVSPSTTCTNTFYQYSPSTQTWSPIAPFTGERRNNLIGGVIGGRYFAGFGHSCFNYFRDWWMYCP